ncbi:hypothetical protein QCE47_02730 [Caballeronia sp. LZ025]|uniref:hypothetical protein n=1 Tax=Caballeronia TaxID=1827195 RepID=UPI001FD5AFA6|nr:MULTISPECIES: hypothetical protein [Caballeronia]MDR5731265.1 hypothetical protein [Caballeronia sp. LZ025]
MKRLFPALLVVASSVAIAQSTPLLLFGGHDHKVFLGCLTCSEYASNSVHNEYGPHGSAYASESIFNHYSDYGSAYSSNSPCNQYANNPPVIVDEDGGFYGRLTLNQYHAQANQNENLRVWLKGKVCE